MNDKFYLVFFESDCNTYYFHGRDNAIRFVWESYCDDNMGIDEETILSDRAELTKYGSIDGYAWIQDEYFED